MKQLGFLLIVAVLFSGCLAEVATTAAIQGTLQAQQMGAMTRQLNGAKESTAKINLQHAIDTYKGEKGANPPSLDALAPNWVPTVPTHPDGSPFGYDPSTGTLYETADEAARSIDSRTIAHIKQAINQYGTAVGYYPPSLDSLAPLYLPNPPRTVGGAEFVYNNQNGAVTVPPGSYGAAAGPAASMPVGGAGPLGETTTAIGMSQQLDSNSNAGASAVGSYGRNAVRGITTGTNDKTNAAMDNLGL